MNLTKFKINSGQAIGSGIKSVGSSTVFPKICKVFCVLRVYIIRQEYSMNALERRFIDEEVHTIPMKSEYD